MRTRPTHHKKNPFREIARGEERDKLLRVVASASLKRHLRPSRAKLAACRAELASPGPRRTSAKLATKVDVLAIRARAAAGEPQRSIGHDLGVSQTTVSRIVNYKSGTP